jgi:hypothetical protein
VRRGHSTCVSLFLLLEACVLQAHIVFHYKERRAGSRVSRIDPKATRAPNGRVSFHLASSSTV